MGNAIKKWTTNEVSILTEMKKNGYSHKEIADELGRTRQSVSDYISAKKILYSSSDNPRYWKGEKLAALKKAVLDEETEGWADLSEALNKNERALVSYFKRVYDTSNFYKAKYLILKEKYGEENPNDNV